MIVSDKVHFFAPAPPCLGRYHPVARTFIEQGEVFLRLPLSACITSAFGEGEGPSWADEQQRLMLSLLRAKRKSDVTPLIKQYLENLPRDFPSLPLFYTAEELATSRGTGLKEALEGDHIACTADLRGLRDWIRGAWQEEVDESELLWAASVVASRAFDVGRILLVPLADNLNHKCVGAHTKLEIEMVDGMPHAVMRAQVPILEGSPIYNNYGERSNLQWVLNGGFVEADNPFDELLISKQELEDIAQIGPIPGPDVFAIQKMLLDISPTADPIRNALWLALAQKNAMGRVSSQSPDFRTDDTIFKRIESRIVQYLTSRYPAADRKGAPTREH
eukprot:GEMP01055355.1.p1 GENE.GEMP01055355.1~~GEMP01055355.1.p1  ORF type:complete len:333 (+),score=60.69 GEMP01055355.1:46-1044(+)